MQDIATTIAGEVGMPINLSMMIQAGLPTMTFGSMAQICDSFPFEEQVGSSVVVREPVGVVGRHHAVELSAAPDRGQGGAGAGRRLHGGIEAQRGGAVERVHPG